MSTDRTDGNTSPGSHDAAPAGTPSVAAAGSRLPATGSTAPVLFTMPVALRWRDLDAFNHVNNSNFLTYLEEARIRWFDSLGEEWVTDATAPLLAAVQVNYKVPIPYPSSVLVELSTQRVGTTSVTLGHRIVSEDGAVLYADGHVVMVWIDRRSGRPTALPDAVRRAADAAS